MLDETDWTKGAEYPKKLIAHTADLTTIVPKLSKIWRTWETYSYFAISKICVLSHLCPQVSEGDEFNWK